LNSYNRKGTEFEFERKFMNFIFEQGQIDKNKGVIENFFSEQDILEVALAS
jgi:hypothetical protein